MNRLQGMTVEQFKGILDDMKAVYNYDDSETRLGGCYDPRMSPDIIQRVEIYTKDKETGVSITMAKDIPEESTWES